MKKLLSVLLLAASALAGPISAQTGTEQPRTISVSATATVERAPDQAVLLLAVESEGATARSAASANATKMDRVLTALRQLGIPAASIRTVSYELQPQYAQDRGDQPRITGYRAVNQVRTELDQIDRVGPTIDAALAAGANRVSSLNFGIKDMAGARLEALAKAVEKARREADVVARAADQTIGLPQTINVDGYFAPRPRPMEMYARSADMSAVAAPTPVEGGTLEVGASVTVIYRLLP